MEFSDILNHNLDVSALISPKGDLLAVAVQNHLHVWDIESKEICHRFKCENVIDFIKWSPDSTLICCGSLKDYVQIFNLEKLHWKCKINEGCLGSDDIQWAPDSRHILVISEFSIKLTIFSLASTVVAEVDSLKAIESVIAFSASAKYLAVAQRVNYKDYIAIHSCDTWEQLKFFEVKTKDFVAFEFSPNDLIISVLEALECNVLFYSIDGRLLGKYITSSNVAPTALSWNLDGRLFALCDFSGEVTILNCTNYEKVASYQCPELIESNEIAIYKATEDILGESCSGALFPCWERNELLEKRPLSFLPYIIDSEKRKGRSLKSGAIFLQFSACGKYIASVNGNMPKVLSMYDVEKNRLCDIMIQNRSIKDLSWHPEKPFLIFCSGSGTVHLWTPHFCIQFMAPFRSDFSIINVTWCPRKKCVIINSKEQASILYLP